MKGSIPMPNSGKEQGNITGSDLPEGKGKVFTQDEVNSFLAKERREIEAKYADYSELKAAKEAADNARIEAMSKEEQLEAQIEKLKRDFEKQAEETATAKIEALRASIASEAEVPARFVVGDTENEMRESVKTFKDFLSNRKITSSSVSRVEDSSKTIGSVSAGMEAYRQKYLRKE